MTSASTDVHEGVPAQAAAPPSALPATRQRPPRWVVTGSVVLVALGVGLRAGTVSPLWLDETLSANIAALPLGEMFDALRRDGHPPLFYLLLKAWSAVFGDGDNALRWLSGVFGVAVLPLLWSAGRRFGGRTCALATLVLYATSPFAIRYSTENRMYALVALLVVAGWLAIRRAEERPTLPRLALVSLIAGALLLSHYWSLFLLAVVGGGFVVRTVRGRLAGRPIAGDLRLTLALAAGGIFFLPWLPSFLAQSGSTGTPWSAPARPAPAVFSTLGDWSGGKPGEAKVLAASIGLLALLALCGRVAGSTSVNIDLRTRPWARPETIVVVGTFTLAIVASYFAESAYTSRYSSVIHPLAILLAGFGVTVLPGLVLRAGFVGFLALIGLGFGALNAVTDRTQAGEIATAIRAGGAGADDLVVYCPDQVAPDTDRRLPDDLEGMTFPDGGDPRFVDWVDYADRMAAADIGAFADDALARAGDGDIWVVWAGTYRTVGDKCEAVVEALESARPRRTTVLEPGNQFQTAQLERFTAP